MSGKTAIKSMILAMLILLSLLQIERLWFENHGLFSSAVPKQTAEQALQELVMEPEYIALYKGEPQGEYHAIDSAGILFGSILKDTGRIIRQLQKMSVISHYDYQALFEQPHILYHFSVPISAEVLARIAQIKMPKEAAAITGMALVPAGLAENRFLMLFFDEDAALVKGFAVLKNDLSGRELIGGIISTYFDFLEKNTSFVNILMWENLNKGKYLEEMPAEQVRRQTLNIFCEKIIEGKKAGIFLPEIDERQTVLSLIVVCFANFSNRYTLSRLFSQNLTEKEILEKRKQHTLDLVLSYMCGKN